MKKVFVLRGLQASGKSTFSRNLLAEEPTEWKRINRDLIREMLDNSVWSAQNEKLVVKNRDFLLSESLRKGYNVIVDDTNLNKKNFEDICKVVASLNLDVQVIEKNFPVELDEAIRRDALRPKPVGEEVIRMTFKKNGLKYDKHYNCRTETFYKKTVATQRAMDPKLPYAIMCDLDGTLALIEARNPYDASRCDEVDVLNEPVAATVLQFQQAGYQIIFVSGRKDTYEPQTRRFIEKHLSGMPYLLYMRQAEDNRKDSLVKSEIFELHIAGKFNPFFVLDDRNQVVEQWREMGLTVFQVADGNF